MYTLQECVVIAGLIFVLSAGLFLIASAVVLVDAGVRGLFTLSRRLSAALIRGGGIIWAYRLRFAAPLPVVESGFSDQIEAGKAAKQVFVE